MQHLTPEQIGHRARLMALRASYRRLPRVTRRRYERMAATQPASWRSWTLLPNGEPLTHVTEAQALEEARAVAQGRFRFVNRAVELGEHPAWRDHGQSQLWSYHLHYFDYLISLGRWWQAERAPEALETAARLMADWIEHNPPARGDGWHPYPVAARLSNWLQGTDLFGTDLRQHPLLESVLLPSITQQVLFLERNLEFDVLGNHLLKNLRALIHCGLALEHPRRSNWVHQGALWTFDQVRHQILPDGGHYERSPMYQLQVFWDLLDILSQLHHADIMLPADVMARFQAMQQWIRAMRHPDGDIPLFNDAVLGMTGAPETALEAGAALVQQVSSRSQLDARSTGLPSVGLPSGDTSLSDSGYYIFSSPNAWLVADAGDPCPDELPAHAHADALSYELSVQGERLVVDAGMFEYQAGMWRDFMRGTGAHNTVLVDRTDQSEVWGSFRVGQRARVHARYWHEHDGVRLLEAEHDGYQDRLGVRHHRWIARVDQRFFVVSDLLDGHGEHEARSFIHLHPDAQVGDAAPTEAVRLIGAARGDAGLLIAPFGQDEVDHYLGCLSSPRAWYSQEFGRRLPSTEISLIIRGAIPRVFGYLLLLDSPASIALETDSPTQWRIRLAFETGSYVVHANAAGIRVER